MNASQGQMNRVDRARFVESGEARDDSPSWNLGRVKQGDTIRDGGTPNAVVGRWYERYGAGTVLGRTGSTTRRSR